MHCFFSQLNPFSSQAQQKSFDKRSLPCDSIQIESRNQILRNILFAFCFIFSGKDAKKMNDSLVTLGETVPSSSLPPTYFTGIYHDPLQVPKPTKIKSVPSQVENSYIFQNNFFSVSLDRKQNNGFKSVKTEDEQEYHVASLSYKTMPKAFIPIRESLSSHEAEEMIKWYKLFLRDYALRMEWKSATFVVPEDGLIICQDFNNDVLLSKAALNLECYTNFISNNGDYSLRQVINSHLLTNYSPKRPILILAGNINVGQKLEESPQKTLATNYKWRLVKFMNKDDSKERKLADGQLEIYEVVGFASSSTKLHQLVGTWNENEGLHIDELKSHGVYSFNGHKLRVTTVSGPPVVNLYKGVVPTFGKRLLTATGYLPDLLDLVSLVLNFTYVILTPGDGKFGERDEYGNWSGMIGMLQRNEADLALMSISYTKTRKSVMDYSPPVEYSSTRFLIRRDWQPAELKWDAFIRPFEWKVWLTILILIMLGTMTLIVFAYFKLFLSTPGQSMWLLSTCFLLQGQTEHSTIRVTPYRIALGTFWALAVFMFACYTARLTSFLAADTDKTPVKDLYEALRSTAWRIGLVKGSSFLEKVKDSDDTEMTLLWRHIQRDSNVLVDGISDGVSKVYKERYIFFTSELIPNFLVRGNCSYTWLPGKYFPGFGSLGYQKDLPYAAGITHVIAKIKEVGLMRRTFKKWWGLESTCNSKGTDAFTAISLNEAGSAFFVLSIGASLALLVTVIEFLMSKRNQGDQLPSEDFAPMMVGNHFTGKDLIQTILKYDKPNVRSQEPVPGV